MAKGRDWVSVCDRLPELGREVVIPYQPLGWKEPCYYIARLEFSSVYSYQWRSRSGTVFPEILIAEWRPLRSPVRSRR